MGALRRQAEGHDVSVQSPIHRVVAAEEKMEGYRQRARAATAAAK